MKRYNKTKGFSLIEMLMVLFIISLATGSIFASLRNSRKKSDLEIAAREFSAIIRQVQNDAISGRKVSDANKTCGLGVAFGVQSGSLRTNYNLIKSEANSCDGGVDVSTVSDYQSELKFKSSFKSDSEKLVFNVAGERWLFFSTPHASVFYGNSGNLSALAAVQKISIRKNYANSDVVDVCVYPSGRIMEGPVHASTAAWNCP